MADQVRVFVSHHHSPEEDAFTARLVADLEAAGADVWVDNKGITSDDFVQMISEGLEGRQWLVLVMTPQSVASKWVRREVNAALNEHTAGRMLGVIPVVITPTPEQDIPVLWRPLHRYEATSGYQPARDGLLRALGLTAPHYPLPDIPERLVSLGFRSANITGTPAIIPPLVSVAAGPFRMGSDKSRDPYASDRELPQHWVELTAFQIGKYPVTVAEYALAVDAGVVHEPPNTPGCETWQDQLQRLDHPVVGVGWEEAMTYTAWLRKVTKQAGWRLPSEAEWEKAARWDTSKGIGRIYPWGDTFDEKRCNTNEHFRHASETDERQLSASGPETLFGKATPVGLHPVSDPYHSGASPYGAEDMVGSVFEWTSSLFKPYPYSANDGREDPQNTGSRTERGSWRFARPWEARSAGRHSMMSRSMNRWRGFRLAFA